MRHIKRLLCILKCFGFKVCLSMILENMYSYYKHPNYGSYIILQLKHKCLMSRLQKEFCTDVKGSSLVKSGDLYHNCIWTFWWQGLDRAPESVKKCVNNMKKYSNGHPVIIVTEENWHQYIDLPEHIIKKINLGIISITHFSDILRMNLLNNYGGLWLDAGIFPVSHIEEEIFEMEYFTRRVKKCFEANVSDSRWCGGITGGKVALPFFSFMVNSFNEYWKKYDFLIDYFLIDYFTAIYYENDIFFRGLVDTIPYNNRDLFRIEPLLNKAYTREQYNDILLNNTFLRLKWRNKYEMINCNGESTLYSCLLSEKL